MGAAASANLHPGRTGMFEPVHGSAPDIAGTGRANPVAAVASVGLMLEVLGEAEAARAVESAIADALTSGALPGLGADTGLTTAAIGDLLAAGVRG
jgi:3-isopropylmalate dehydrogenase